MKNEDLIQLLTDLNQPNNNNIQHTEAKILDIVSQAPELLCGPVEGLYYDNTFLREIMTKDNISTKFIHDIIDVMISKEILFDNEKPHGGTKDVFFNTPLSLALKRGWFEVAEKLVDNGAKLNVKVSGQDADTWLTPLQILTYQYGTSKTIEGNNNIISLAEKMLAKGADAKMSIALNVDESKLLDIDSSNKNPSDQVYFDKEYDFEGQKFLAKNKYPIKEIKNFEDLKKQPDTMDILHWEKSEALLKSALVDAFCFWNYYDIKSLRKDFFSKPENLKQIQEFRSKLGYTEAVEVAPMSVASAEEKTIDLNNNNENLIKSYEQVVEAPESNSKWSINNNISSEENLNNYIISLNKRFTFDFQVKEVNLENIGKEILVEGALVKLTPLHVACYLYGTGEDDSQNEGLANIIKNMLTDIRELNIDSISKISALKLLDNSYKNEKSLDFITFTHDYNYFYKQLPFEERPIGPQDQYTINKPVLFSELSGGELTHYVRKLNVEYKAKTLYKISELPEFDSLKTETFPSGKNPDLLRWTSIAKEIDGILSNIFGGPKVEKINTVKASFLTKDGLAKVEMLTAELNQINEKATNLQVEAVVANTSIPEEDTENSNSDNNISSALEVVDTSLMGNEHNFGEGQ